MIGSLFPTRQLYSPLHRFMIHRSHHLSRSESFTIDLIKHDAMALSTTASLFYMAFHLATAPTDKTFRAFANAGSTPFHVQTARLCAAGIPPATAALQYPSARRAHGCLVHVLGSEHRGSSDPLSRPSLTDHAGRMRPPHG